MKRPLKKGKLSAGKCITASKLICLVIDHYLQPDDFKGLSIARVESFREQSVSQIKAAIRPIIEQGRITVRCDGIDVNPFIKRMPDLSTEKEVRRLNEWQGGVLIVYPTRKELETAYHVEEAKRFVEQPPSLF